MTWILLNFSSCKAASRTRLAWLRLWQPPPTHSQEGQTQEAQQPETYKHQSLKIVVFWKSVCLSIPLWINEKYNQDKQYKGQNMKLSAYKKGLTWNKGY